ncbi:MAG: hypothetical protein V7604_189 [Hyphomicrobiales bacterium]|jgi:hypothetical protein
MIEIDQSLDQHRKVRRARADMVRDRALRVAVVLADESVFLAQSQLHKALVADDDALQAQELILIERGASRFADRPPPMLDAVLRRPFAFDDIARL